MATPTIRKLQLGNELRRIRDEAGRSPAEAALVIGSNTTKISKLELGQSGIALGDLKMLLEFYGDDPEHIEWMMSLSRNNRERGRWTGYRAAFPEWFRVYVDLERDAEDIRWAEVELVPGLLQTEQYMRSLSASTPTPGAPPDVEEVVRARLERQQILERDDPPTLSFILSESCVRRMVGGVDVMVAQLEHLVRLAERRDVQIQMRPFDAESTAGAVFRFITLRIPAPASLLRWSSCTARTSTTPAISTTSTPSACTPRSGAPCRPQPSGRSRPGADSSSWPRGSRKDDQMIRREAEPAGADWFTSTFTDGNGTSCVEVAFLGGAVAVRDTTQRGGGPILRFTCSVWASFIAGVRGGEFDLP